MPEVETIWTNVGGDFDFTNDNNWTDLHPKNGTPAGTDYTAIFDGSIANVAPTVNLDCQNTVNQLTFMESYTAGIGSVGTPLEIEIDSTDVSIPTEADKNHNCCIKGKGEYHIKFNTGGFSDVIIDKPRDGAIAYLYGTLRILVVRSGDVELAATGSLTMGLALVGNGELTIAAPDAAESAPKFIYVGAGMLINARATTADADGSLWVHGGICKHTGSINTATRILVDGGLFRWQPSADPGTTPKLWGMGGIVDFSKSGFPLAFTEKVIGPGCQFKDSRAGSVSPAPTSFYVDLRDDVP